MRRIDIRDWKKVRLEALFDIVKGTRLTKKDMKEGSIDYVGASAFNNGITSQIGNDEHLHPAGTLTVAYNGSIGQTFYHEQPYWATDDVNVLYPKFCMTKAMALFIAPLIKAAGKKYMYADKWQLKDMQACSIYLPQDKDGNPDWEYMDSYMSEQTEKSKKRITLFTSILGCKRAIINTSVSGRNS